jgi:hypothetical protein
LNVVFAFGFAAWKSTPILPNASVSEAAADTVMFPVILETVVVVAFPVVVAALLPLLPHPFATSPTTTAAANQVVRRAGITACRLANGPSAASR